MPPQGCATAALHSHTSPQHRGSDIGSTTQCGSQFLALFCCPQILQHNWTATRKKGGMLMLHFYKEVLSITSACSILVTYNYFTIGRLHTSRNVLRLQLCHKTTFLFFACLPFFFFFFPFDMMLCFSLSNTLFLNTDINQYQSLFCLHSLGCYSNTTTSYT